MWQSIRDMRIRNKLFLAYSCLFVISAVVAGVVIYSQVRTIIEKSIESELVRTTGTIANMVRANAAASIKNYLRAVAEKDLDVARDLHRQAQRGLITEEEAKQRASQVFLSQSIGKTGFIYCLDSNGVMVVHPKRSLVDVDMTGLPFAGRQMEQKTGYLEYEWKEPLEQGSRTKAIYMTYFEPWDWIISVSTYTEEFSELVKIEDFRKRILNMGFGESGYPFVIDYDGVLLIHPFLENKHHDEFNDPRLSKVAERIIKERNGSFNYSWKNPDEETYRRKVAYFRDIPEMGWIVASSSYLDDFYGPLTAIGYVIVGATVILLILMIPITMWVSSVITRPLKRLQRNFSQAAGGDFSVRMNVKTKDEIGLLGGYFNYFMERLTAYSDDLQNEIVERKKAEKELIALDKAKTLFLSSASHELRTPLTSIIGFLKLMEGNFKKRFQPVLKEQEGLDKYVDRFAENMVIVRSESDRLGRLVNDLLDLNKIESGRMEWRDESLKVEDILIRASEAISGYASDNPELDFVVDAPWQALFVKVDSDRIHQVLINLLSNAFKYTEEGEVTLAAESRSDGVLFMVTDTGRGISVEDRDKVFDLFYQAHDENRRSSKIFGTGLGLAISQQIVAHYGGRLTVESEQDEGSCFMFTIPKD